MLEKDKEKRFDQIKIIDFGFSKHFIACDSKDGQDCQH